MLEQFDENVTQYLTSGLEDYLDSIETELENMDINTLDMFAAMLKVIKGVASDEATSKRIKRLQNLNNALLNTQYLFGDIF